MGGSRVYFFLCFYFYIISCLNSKIISTLNATKIFDSQLNVSLGTIFSRVSVLNESKVDVSIEILGGNSSVINDLFNDTRCNHSVVNGIKYLNSLESQEEYVECVSIGVGRSRACSVNGVVANLSGIGCEITNKFLSMSNVSLRSLTKNLLLVSEELQFIVNVTECGENDANCTFSNETKLMPIVSSYSTLCNQTIANNTQSIVNCSVENESSVVKRLSDVVSSFPFMSNYSFGAQNSSECVNGVLDVFSSTNVCICLVDFVGEACEALMVMGNVTTYYSQVLNGTFNMDTYEPFLKIKSGQPCYLKFVNLLGSENQVLVDYKSFIDNIVGNYWTQFDRQGWFMLNVDYENVWNSSDAGIQIQKMRFYTQKIYDDLTDNFIQYRRTLKRLSKIYKNNSETIFRKAKSFGKIMPFSNFTSYEKEIKTEIGLALGLVAKIYDEYLSFYEVGNVSNDTISSIALLKTSTIKYSSMVNDYGFWYFINKISSSAKYITNYNQVCFF